MKNPRLQSVTGTAALRYFNEVAQAGSFRQASVTLGIAPSAIHRQIGLLEEQLGTPLLHRVRGSGGVRLTAAGEALAYRIGRAMSEMSLALSEIDDLTRARRGRVRIGTSDALAMDLLAPVIGDFRVSHPRIDMDVRVADKAELLANYEKLQLDVMIFYNAPPQIGLRIVEEVKLPSYVVVRRDHPLAQSGRATVSLSECVAYPMALVSDAIVQDGIIGRIAAATGTRPHIALRTNSYVLMREAIAYSDMVSIQGALDGRFRHPNPDLVNIPLREALGRFSTLSFCTPIGRRLPAAADLFMDAMISAFRVR